MKVLKVKLCVRAISEIEKHTLDLKTDGRGRVRECYEGFGHSKNLSLLLCSHSQLPVHVTAVPDHNDSC